MEATFSRGVLGCPRKLGSMVRKMGYNLLINGVSWGYDPLTNLLLMQGHPSRHLSNGLLYKPRSLFNMCTGSMPSPSRNIMGSLLAIPPLMAGFSFSNYSIKKLNGTVPTDP